MDSTTTVAVDNTDLVDEADIDQEDDISHEDISNMPSTSTVPTKPIPTSIQRNHPTDNVIGPLTTGVKTRSQAGEINECMFTCFISQIEPMNIDMALQESSWVDAMHNELNQFTKLKVWKFVSLPKGKKALGTRWVFKNK